MASSEQKMNKPSPGAMFLEVEGVHIPKLFQTNRPMAEHIECLKALEMQPSDVMILALPKSGTHLTWEIVSMLVSGRADYEPRTKDYAMVEAVEIEYLQAQPSPRVLNSHLPLRLLPRQIKEKKVKVIHVYRNIKDIVVSKYFHFQQMVKDTDQDFEHHVREICSGDLPGWKYVDYLKEMDDDHKNNPDMLYLTIAFEDIKEDPERAVRKLAEFLEVEASPELCRSIAEATNFQKMKQANNHKDRGRLSNVDVYRKGEVGDWKNYLTPEQSARLDAEVTKLASYDYHFRYTL